MQLSVTQGNDSLIFTSPVLYLALYNLCYEPWSQKRIERFGSKVANLVFIFGINSEF